MKDNKPRKHRVFWILLALVFAGAFIFSAYQLCKIYADYRAGEKSYAALETYIRFPTESASLTPTEDSSETQTNTQEETPSIRFPEVDFAALQTLNPDVVAWIYCEDTTINYPVVQAEDNDYYLRRMLDGSYNHAGCIFLDYRNADDFSDCHSIVYGHHMRNDTMFSSLVSYQQQTYYDAHPQLLLMTPQKNYVIDVFAGYVASETEDAWRLSFDTPEDLEAWTDAAMTRSCFESGGQPAPEDRLITLSTCSYEYEGARFVLHGVLRPVP